MFLRGMTPDLIGLRPGSFNAEMRVSGRRWYDGIHFPEGNPCVMSEDLEGMGRGSVGA